MYTILKVTDMCVCLYIHTYNTQTAPALLSEHVVLKRGHLKQDKLLPEMCVLELVVDC